MTINHVRSPSLTTRRPDGMLMTGLSFDYLMTHACRLFIRRFGPLEHDQRSYVTWLSHTVLFHQGLPRLEDR